MNGLAAAAVEVKNARSEGALPSFEAGPLLKQWQREIGKCDAVCRHAHS